MARYVVYTVLVLISLLITLQSAHTLYLTLYTWNRPHSEAGAPEVFKPPKLSFTVMLPARHEEAVIKTTIGRVAGANYPAHLIQILVVCAADDVGTIGRAEEKIRELRRTACRMPPWWSSTTAGQQATG
jgi:cellulose synthase/poly-beta-1,6-N-acetylglucosamine synthase-like glycosyltransferase